MEYSNLCQKNAREKVKDHWFKKTDIFLYIRSFWQHLVVNWRGRNTASGVTHITDHVVLFVFFIGYFYFLSLQGEVKFSWLEKLNTNSYKSAEVWKPMMAGPGMSVT